PRLCEQCAHRRRGAALAAMGALGLHVIAPAPPPCLDGVPRVVVDGVSKMFGRGGAGEVLADVRLEIRTGEFLCILGPSGCGKSTLLNIVAGFLPPTSGRVLIDGAPVTGPGAERGVVFQEYVLFPWLTVAQNVEFGPRLKGVSAEERQRLAERYLALV